MQPTIIRPTIRTTTPQRERVREVKLSRWAALVCFWRLRNAACAAPAEGWLLWCLCDRRVVSWEV